MEKEILIFGHKSPDTDSVCSAMVKERLNEKNGYNNSKAVVLGKINKETQYVLDYLNIKAPEVVSKVEPGQKVILVDHNEASQSVEGIKDAKIIGVVDHHRIANIETSEPLYYTAKPYGSTSTILYQDYLAKGLEINKEEAVLMLSAIVSDTLLLKSPTTTKHDVKAAEALEKISGVNMYEYGLEMLKAGTDLDEYSPEELIELDAKELDKDGTKFAIAQVNTVDINDVLKRQEEIELAINNVISKKGYSLFVFAITDIVNSNTEIISLGDMKNTVEEAFLVELKNNRAFLPGVVSRKKQILPNIDKIIK